MPETPSPVTPEVEREKLNLLNLTRATVVLLSDYPPKPVDAVFFHGRSYFDAGKQDLFKLAADMVNSGQARFIVMLDSEGQRVGETRPRVAYPGKTLWTNRLVVDMGVDPEKILYSPPLDDNTGFNTKTEGNSFLELAHMRNFKTAVVLTQPHQIVRAVLGLVRTINNKGYKIDLYSACPQTTDWQKRVKGSQGLELKPRFDHIEDEMKRVFVYQAKGDLASFDELFAYLTARGGV